MIDQSEQLASPAWRAVVGELAGPAGDDRAFTLKLLRVLVRVCGAQRAALVVPRGGDTGAEDVLRIAQEFPETDTQENEGNLGGEYAGGGHAQEIKRAARGAMEAGASKVYMLEGEGASGTSAYYTPSSASGQATGAALAVPMGSRGDGGAPAGAVVIVVEPRASGALQSTLAMMEVLCGYVYLHSTRQQLVRTQQAGFSLDLATRLIASINAATGFKGAMMQMVNDLARQLGVDRVAAGWVSGKGGSTRTKVVTMSDSEHFDRRMAMVAKLEAAMDECLDQKQAVLCPAPPAEGDDADVLLSQAVTHAHKELVRGDARLKACSVPLRVGDEVVGVVTIESAGDGAIDTATVELIQAAMDLVAPVLSVRRSDDRNLALRTLDTLQRAGGWAVGPTHTVWKLVAIAALAGLIFVSTYTTTYRVGAEAVIQPRVQRVVSAPIDGVLASLGENARIGQRVQQGDVLVQLETYELKLAMSEARSKVVQAEKQASAARALGESAKALQYEAQAEQARGELQRIEYRIEQATIRAPITGRVIDGRLDERVGSTVKTGESLLMIADTNDLLVVAQVDERDIALVRRAAAEGTPVGHIATRADPNTRHPFAIEHIVEMARAAEGTNVFEVRGTLTTDNAHTAISPGMEGLARIDTQEHTLLWIGTRRILDVVRLWLW